MSRSVFISHSWNDKPLARKLAEILRNLEVSVWLDEAEIKLGDSLIEKIRTGIDSVDFVIALISKNSVSSEWVKKELDIAMNQEIEGKSVKVLPILAGKCSLPGFLKGKLYADMSTPVKFKKSLPLLLERLNVPRTLIFDMTNGKSVVEVTNSSEQIYKIAEALESDNPALQYDVLKSLISYKHKEIIKHQRILDLLLDKLNASTSRHIRLETLRVIGFLEDPNFADLVMPIVYDPDETVAARAIETLADLKAQQKGPLLLTLLLEQEKTQRQRAVLRFLERISFPDEADALSAVASVLQCQEDCLSDPGNDVRTARIICNQWNGSHDSILDRLISILNSGSSEVRMTILEGIKEISVDMWIRRSEIRERFKDELRKIFRSNVDTEVAIAWIIALSMYDFPREDVWVSIAETRASAIKAFFFELEIEGYLLKHFFNEAQDINQLMQLLEVVDDDLKPKVLDVLAETESQDAMNALAKYNYKTPGWKALYVINGLASVSEWTVNLIKFLDDIEKLADLNSNQAKALVLICRLHARQITLEELVQRFPKNGVSATWRRGYDVRNELNRLKAVVPTPLKRKITVLIDALTDEDAY